jgi:hypothetical protein
MTALLTVVLAFGALAGCTGNTTGGTPTTPAATGTGQTSSTPTSGDSSPGLDISKYATKPCDILKPDQLATLGSVREGATGTGALGQNCTWRGQDVTKNSSYIAHVSVGMDFDDQAAGSKQSNSFFEEKKIGDLRAYSTDGTDGAMFCLTTVETSKTDSITVQFSSAAAERGTKKPCSETERVAQLIITNLKG